MIEDLKELIKTRLEENKSIYDSLLERHKKNREYYDIHQDSISAQKQVIRDEEDGYICEIWGRINELEFLYNKLESYG